MHFWQQPIATKKACRTASFFTYYTLRHLTPGRRSNSGKGHIAYPIPPDVARASGHFLRMPCVFTSPTPFSCRCCFWPDFYWAARRESASTLSPRSRVMISSFSEPNTSRHRPPGRICVPSCSGLRGSNRSRRDPMNASRTWLRGNDVPMGAVVAFVWPPDVVRRYEIWRVGNSRVGPKHVLALI